MLSIGSFSQLSQVSVKTLRFYEHIGLLKPSSIDPRTSYRYYSPHLVARVRRISALKQLGFSLEEVASLLRSDPSPSQMREKLFKKREDVATRVEAERMRIEHIDAWIAELDSTAQLPHVDVVRKQLPRQMIASVRDKIGSYDDASELLAELKSHLRRFRMRGQDLAIWHACENQADRIDCEAAIVLNRPVKSSGRVRVYDLPAAIGACAVPMGDDSAFRPAYLAIRNWIETRGYLPAGPSRELYWRQADGSVVTEIQFPISSTPN